MLLLFLAAYTPPSQFSWESLSCLWCIISVQNLHQAGSGCQELDKAAQSEVAFTSSIGNMGCKHAGLFSHWGNTEGKCVLRVESLMAGTAATWLSAGRTISELNVPATRLCSLTLESLYMGECRKKSCSSNESVEEIGTVTVTLHTRSAPNYRKNTHFLLSRFYWPELSWKTLASTSSSFSGGENAPKTQIQIWQALQTIWIKHALVPVLGWKNL